MLGNNAFYHNIIRKYIVAFGSLFNDIHVIRSTAEGVTVKDITIPIAFAPKDKARYQINAINSDRNAINEIGAILPRLSFALANNIEYDTLRTLNPLLTRKAKIDTTTLDRSEVMIGRPFNFSFQLSIWTKYLDDMFQIVEQILCFFNPDYHVTIKEIPELNIETSVPIVFQGCSPNIETEFNDTAWRIIRFDMDFVLKGWIYPPIKDSGIINNIKLNFYSDLDDDKKVSIIKNEYDDENGLLYHAIVDNTESFFSDVDADETIKPYAQLTLNVYKDDEEPTLAADETMAYWINETTGQKYIIRKSGDSQTLIPY